MGIDTSALGAVSSTTSTCGNEEKPEWALTHPQTGLKSYMMKCGNEEKPEWALTQRPHVLLLRDVTSGNEEKPEWALTQSYLNSLPSKTVLVEMKRSPKWK